ncbi:glycosyltransferase [Microvirga terrae]|uniref:Chitooligosaccharide deacetylase n=1 Tax=Microvirga terrae TaxID=2740529 RepID=A0ABY5RN47_9HYPH|nr:glycosyltransferase [Microvirga terrae]UVF18418.1 glycosyltransferase [Microvirga terrae]
MYLPSVSIIIPTYQRCAVVCDALAAIKRIRYSGVLEVIIVVDGSTDGTSEALANISAQFPIHVISQENRGASSARNRGAQAASGDVLLFMDDDMMADPDIVEQHARSYREGADAVLGDIPLDPNSPPNFLSAGVGEWAAERRQRLTENSQLSLFDLLTGQLSVRRSVFEELGGFDENFTRNGSFGDEDLDFGTRLLARFNVAFNPHAVSYQRYVVSYESHLRQWFQAGIADVAFARKHPALAESLFELHGASDTKTRLMFIPLSRIPGLAKAVGSLACWFVKHEPRNRLMMEKTKRLFFIARDLLYWRGVYLAGGIPRDRPLLVLCYHSIRDLAADPILKPYAVPFALFEQQISYLQRHGFSFIGGNELAAYLKGEAGLPRKSVLLTFDDCYEDLLLVAAPFLAEHAIPAVAFAVTGLASNTNEWDHCKGHTKLQLLDGSGLQAVSKMQIEVGAHSRTHRSLVNLSTSELSSETEGAAADIEALGLPRPRYFAYPFGEEDHNARDAVRRSGFQAGFGLYPTRFKRNLDVMAIPRVEVLSKDTGFRFWLKMNAPEAIAVFRKFHTKMSQAGLRRLA